MKYILLFTIAVLNSNAFFEIVLSGNIDMLNNNIDNVISKLNNVKISNSNC